MLAVPVFNAQGEPKGEATIDPALLGGEVRPALMKQAVVAFLDRQRQHSARTKGRGDVAGSTRKLYRQKGTGNARMGTIRTCIRRGGGVAFGKRVPGRVKTLSKKMRRGARNSAILARISAQDALIVDGWECEIPRTKHFAALMSALGVDRGCVFAVPTYDKNVHLSGRNIPKTDIRVVDDLTTYDILRRRKLVFTKAAFDRLTELLAGATSTQPVEA